MIEVFKLLQFSVVEFLFLFITTLTRGVSIFKDVLWWQMLIYNALLLSFYSKGGDEILIVARHNYPIEEHPSPILTS